MVAAVRPRARVVVCLAKGMEVGTGRRMTEIIAEQLPAIPIVALTGPSHAEEVVRGVPTAVVAASDDRAAAERIQSLFSGETFRVYTSDDVVGVEVAAALKNIIAIAAGIADGLGYESADNLKGALLTRGLTEISRLGIRMGAKPETFAGLAGIGDLVTTCLSRHSRNRHVGEQIGRGRTLEETLAAMSMVAEGVNTTRAAVVLAQRLEVKMPIAEAVHRVLNGETHPREALTELMLRPLRSEMPLDAPA
jgi:glycerol-3-phosphate dehydrogenase (NAD(P)+)